MWRSNQLSYRTEGCSNDCLSGNGVKKHNAISASYRFTAHISAARPHLSLLIYISLLHSNNRNTSSITSQTCLYFSHQLHRHSLISIIRNSSCLIMCNFSSHTEKRSSRKEVFQPHLPVRLPCYDLAPITGFTLGRSLRLRTSGTPGFHGLTGGVYKARERIHRAMADARLLANPASWSRVADSSPN